MNIYQDIFGYPAPRLCLCADCGAEMVVAAGEEISLCPHCEGKISRATVAWPGGGQ